MPCFLLMLSEECILCLFLTFSGLLSQFLCDVLRVVWCASYWYLEYCMLCFLLLSFGVFCSSLMSEEVYAVLLCGVFRSICCAFFLMSWGECVLARLMSWRLYIVLVYACSRLVYCASYRSLEECILCFFSMSGGVCTMLSCNALKIICRASFWCLVECMLCILLTLRRGYGLIHTDAFGIFWLIIYLLICTFYSRNFLAYQLWTAILTDFFCSMWSHCSFHVQRLTTYSAQERSEICHVEWCKQHLCFTFSTVRAFPKQFWVAFLYVHVWRKSWEIGITSCSVLCNIAAFLLCDCLLSLPCMITARDWTHERIHVLTGSFSASFRSAVAQFRAILILTAWRGLLT